MFGSHRVCDRRIKRDGYVETEDQLKCVAAEDLLLMVGSPAPAKKNSTPRARAFVYEEIFVFRLDKACD